MANSLRFEPPRGAFRCVFRPAGRKIPRLADLAAYVERRIDCMDISHYYAALKSICSFANGKITKPMVLRPINPVYPIADCRSDMVEPATLRHERLRELHERWQKFRGAGRFPGYDQFRPETMWDVVGSIIMAAVEARRPPVFRYRLHGTRAAFDIGQDMTGRTLQEFNSPPFGAMVRHDYAQALEKERAFAHRVTIWRGGVSSDYDRVILPLAEDGETIDTLFVVSRGPAATGSRSSRSAGARPGLPP